MANNKKEKKDKAVDSITQSEETKQEVATQTPSSAEVSGGEIEPAIVVARPKYGRFFRGVDSIEGERAYKALYNANRNAGGWGMTNMALRAIEDGNDVYRGSDGSIVIKDLSGNDITDKYLPSGVTAKVSDRQGKKNWGATFNSANHRFRVSGEYLDSIDLTPEDLRQELRRGTGTGFFTVKDANGQNVYDTNSKQNQDYENLIKELIAYTQGDPKELDKKYKYSNWKEADRLALLNLKDELAADPGFANALINRARTGALTDADKDILSKMGILASKQVSGGKEGDTGTDTKKLFQLEGIDADAAKRYGITGIKENTDEEGNTYYTVEGDDYTGSTWDLYGFDSVFGKTKFNNGWIHNGRLYANGDENKAGELQNAIRNYLGTRMHKDENFSDFWNRRKASGVRFLGDRENPLYDFDYNTTFDYGTKGALYNYFKSNNIGKVGLTDMSRYYGLDNGSLYGYIDTAGEAGIHGNPTMKYIDNKGNLVNINNYTRAAFPDTRVPTLDFSTLKDGKFHYGIFNNKDKTARVSVEWNPVTNLYNIYRENTKTGERISPVNIHSSWTEDFLNYLKNENWQNWGDLEKMSRAKTGSSGRPRYLSVYDNSPTPDLINTDKNGGTINWKKVSRLAEGGIFGSGDVTAANVKMNDEKVSDITKSHALDGSDGGLTQAELLQIGAAVGDIAGVAASAIPGLSTAIGAASSTTRFIADIKKDGFQGKDAWSFAGNLLLDTAALLPGLGTGAKMYKAVKVIKGVGQPLLKWLSIYGASQSVINAAQKVISGEKFTGEDMANLISGIGSTAIAAKSIRKDIGQAKLAKKVDSKVAESFNKSINTPKTATADGFTINKTPKELEELMKEVKTKSGAINKLKELATAQGKTLSDENAEKILKDLGVDITKGKLNFSFKNNKLKNGFFGRGEELVEFTAPSKQEVGSTFSYLLSPRKRVKALGWEATYGIPTKKANTNLGDSVSSNEVYSAIERVQSGKGSLLDKALLEASVVSPGSFGNTFYSNGQLSPVSSVKAFTIGGKRYFRSPKITNNRLLLPAPGPGNLTPVNVNHRRAYFSPSSNIIETESSLPTTTIPHESILRNIGITDSRLLPSPKEKPRLALPAPNSKTILALPMPPGYSPINTNVSPTIVPHKLPGGSGVVYLPLKEGSPIITPYKSPDPYFKEWELEQALRGRPESPYMVDMPLSTARTYYYGPSALEFLAFKEGGKIPKYKIGGFAGIDKKQSIANTALNILPGALDTIELGRVLSANSKYSDKLKEAALKANVYATSPHLNAPRLDLSPIEQGRNNARNAYLSQIAGINPSSDSNLNRAQALATAETILNLDNRVNEQITNAVSQNNAQRAEVNNQNRINEANTAYQNDKQNSAVQQAIAETEANKIQSISSAISDFGQQARTMFRTYRAGMNDINTSEALSNLTRDLNNKKDEFIKPLKDEYDSAIKGGTVTDSFEDWVRSDTARYKRYTDALDTSFDPISTNRGTFSYWYNTEYLPNYRKIQQQRLLSKSFKKGGKVEESITSKIALENSKMSKQAIIEMNKQLLALLNKLVK